MGPHKSRVELLIERFSKAKVAEIHEEGFFTASTEGVGHPKRLNWSLGVDMLEWYYSNVRVRQLEETRKGGPPAPMLRMSRVYFQSATAHFSSTRGAVYP